MSSAFQLLNRYRAKLKSERKSVDVSSDAVSAATTETISSSAVSQRFPSAALTNDAFVNIDDNWPKDADVRRKINFFGIIRRFRKWVQNHRKLSIFIAVGIFGIIAIAVVAGVTVTLRRKKSGDNNITISITTTEATNSGSLYYATIRSYRMRSPLTNVRLRPDKRQHDGYILTTAGSVIFLKKCSSARKQKQIWKSSEVRECETSELKIENLFPGKNCSCCEVFDVEDECRGNQLLCSHSTFVYCCNLCISGDSFCSIYGVRITGKQSQLLDGNFELQNDNSSQFKFSLLGPLLRNNSCMLQMQMLSVTNEFNELSTFPANNCPFDMSELSRVIKMAIGQQFYGKKVVDWTAALMVDGILRLSSSENVTHQIFNIYHSRSTAEIHISSSNTAIFIAITSSGVVSMIKIDEEFVTVVQPHCLHLSFPGNYVGGFLNGESLVLYNVDEAFIYVAEVKFRFS